MTVRYGHLRRKDHRRLTYQPDARSAPSRNANLFASRGPLEVPPEAVAKFVSTDHGRDVTVLSGASRTRTDGLRAASATLFQLSYSPGKLILGRPV